MTAPAASNALTPDPALVARFRADLAALCDPERERVLLAVSGGADSTALLLLAHAALGGRCHAATVDHGLRPEAAGEAAAVARLCATLGVAHATLAAPMPARVRRTANLSARARALRYRLLEDHARTIGAHRIATAHHADDQLETLIMRLNRGSGVTGLAGIRPAGGMTIRPLLGWRRAELATLVARAGIAAIEDPSNVDDRFDRARLRKVLADAGWLDADQWRRSAAALGDAEAALEWATRDVAQRCCMLDGDRATLNVDDQPAELLRRLVLRCLVHVDPAADPRGSQVARLTAAIAAARENGADLRATLGNVLIERVDDHASGVTIAFAPAPPRRSG
ncbi:MAG TPA: tRNA lysidine(34) synthetase TilS [Sphingomonas sp.]|nr:tRNA lysidine(34) synthetase TilS [Sphingomonas sp.]